MVTCDTASIDTGGQGEARRTPRARQGGRGGDDHRPRHARRADRPRSPATAVDWDERLERLERQGRLIRRPRKPLGRRGMPRDRAQRARSRDKRPRGAARGAPRMYPRPGSGTPPTIVPLLLDEPVIAAHAVSTLGDGTRARRRGGAHHRRVPFCRRPRDMNGRASVGSRRVGFAPEPGTARARRGAGSEIPPTDRVRTTASAAAAPATTLRAA